MNSEIRSIETIKTTTYASYFIRRFISYKDSGVDKIIYVRVHFDADDRPRQIVVGYQDRSGSVNFRSCHFKDNPYLFFAVLDDIAETLDVDLEDTLGGLHDHR